MNFARVPSTESPETPIVFVVDDDVSVRESLRALILCTDWRIETFRTAGEFLAHPRPSAPGCLVCDISLPDLSGLELHQHIGLNRAELPVIFITGHDDVRFTARAMKAGAAELLTKPFAAEDLLRAVQRAMTRSESALALSREVEGTA
jgi:FixJ family two-component response regulator